MTFEELQEKIDTMAATADIKGFKKLASLYRREDYEEDVQIVFCDYLTMRERAVKSRLSGSIMEAQQWEYEAELIERGTLWDTTRKESRRLR